MAAMPRPRETTNSRGTLRPALPRLRAAPETQASRLARTMALRRDLRRFSLIQVKSGVPAMKPTAPMAKILPMRLGERPKVPPI